MLRDLILQTPNQWRWEAAVIHEEQVPITYDRVIVCGMGGSHLAADMLAVLYPELRIMVHSDYGLPYIGDEEQVFVIASSYSGNTEETLDAARTAKERDLPLAIIASGGELLRFAEEHEVPHVALPALEIQPRYALGYSLVAHAAMLGRDDVLSELRDLSATFEVAALEGMAQSYAEVLEQYTPIIYASSRNAPVAYNWKIKCNESGKVPAFYNVIPELNHNEMEGFNRFAGTEDRSRRLMVFALRDNDDPLRIRKRFDALGQVYTDKGVEVIEVNLIGSTHLEKILFGITLADWITLGLADRFGYDPIPVAMVEDFKARLANQ